MVKRYLFTDGRSYPGGLENGGFDCLSLPTDARTVRRFLLNSFAADEAERKHVLAWETDGAHMVGPAGVNVYQVILAKAPQSRSMRRIGTGLALGRYPVVWQRSLDDIDQIEALLASLDLVSEEVLPAREPALDGVNFPLSQRTKPWRRQEVQIDGDRRQLEKLVGLWPPALAGRRRVRSP